MNGSVAFAGADKAIAKVDGTGEPWRFGLLPEQLAAFLRERGLKLLCDLGADEYRAKVMGARAVKCGLQLLSHGAGGSAACPGLARREPMPSANVFSMRR